MKKNNKKNKKNKTKQNKKQTKKTTTYKRKNEIELKKERKNKK